MKVLRVSMGFPTESVPGSGLNCYYHSKHSRFETCIITTKKESQIIPLNKDVRYEEIRTSRNTIVKDGRGRLLVLFGMLQKALAQYFFFVRSRRILDEYKPDVVHVYTPIPICFGKYCKKKYGSTYVMSLHGSDIVRIRNNKYLVKLLNATDAVLSVADNMEATLRDVGVTVPIYHMGNGVDFDVFRNTHIERKKQFLQVGSFRWQKGKEYLIRAFAKFCEQYPDYSLILIGEGEDFDKIKSLSKELCIEDKVTFTGNISQAEIAEYLNESMAFVLSSVSEGFPKAIYEAMATGTPVIASNLEGFSDVIRDSGILVEPKDINALFRAMIEIISEENWKIRSDKSERYASEYSWQNVAKKLDGIYETVRAK